MYEGSCEKDQKCIVMKYWRPHVSRCAAIFLSLLERPTWIALVLTKGHLVWYHDRQDLDIPVAIYLPRREKTTATPHTCRPICGNSRIIRVSV